MTFAQRLRGLEDDELELVRSGINAAIDRLCGVEMKMATPETNAVIQLLRELRDAAYSEGGRRVKAQGIASNVFEDGGLDPSGAPVTGP